jgi:hypothetical protein
MRRIATSVFLVLVATSLHGADDVRPLVESGVVPPQAIAITQLFADADAKK